MVNGKFVKSERNVSKKHRYFGWAKRVRYISGDRTTLGNVMFLRVLLNSKWANRQRRQELLCCSVSPVRRWIPYGFASELLCSLDFYNRRVCWIWYGYDRRVSFCIFPFRISKTHHEWWMVLDGDWCAWIFRFGSGRVTMMLKLCALRFCVSNVCFAVPFRCRLQRLILMGESGRSQDDSLEDVNYFDDTSSHYHFDPEFCWFMVASSDCMQWASVSESGWVSEKERMCVRVCVSIQRAATNYQ